MNKLDLKNITETLLDVFFEAGEKAKEISERGVKVTIKPDNSPVTDGDIEVDNLLRNKIQNLTPSIPIISEETVDLKKINKSKNFWLVDPIDGTRDYINKRDEYTLNASLIINFKPVAGVVYAPAKNRMFYSYGKNFAYEIRNKEKISLNCKKINNNEIIGLENSGKTPPEVLKIYDNFSDDYFKDIEKNNQRYDNLFEYAEKYVESISNQLTKLNLWENSIVLIF